MSGRFVEKKLIKYFEKISNVRKGTTPSVGKRVTQSNPKKIYTDKLRLAEIDYQNRVFLRKVEAINSREGHYNAAKLKRESLTVPKGVERAKTFRKNVADENLKKEHAVF